MIRSRTIFGALLLSVVTLLLVTGCTEEFSPERLPTPQSVRSGRALTV